MYTTWTFQQAHETLCNSNPACGPDCLTNLTCMGGEDKYYQADFYWKKEYFNDDDGKVDPLLDYRDVRCPVECCRFRRKCLRTHDVLGSPVPFERLFLVVFGGRTYEHTYDPQSGELVYHLMFFLTQS